MHSKNAVKPQNQESESSLSEILATEKIRYVMRTEPYRVETGSPARDAIEGIKARSTSYALVCDGPTLMGIFTERDYLDKVAGSKVELDGPIDDFMTGELRSLTPEASLSDALGVIVDGGCRHIPVVDDGKLVGMLSALDLVKYIAELFPTEVYNLPPNLDQVMTQVEGG